MQFNSLQFLIFFPLIAAGYFLLSYRYRWIILLAASYYFYMCWNVEYILLILVSTLIAYDTGLRMGRTSQKKKRKKYLIASLLANLGILFCFKYFNFFSESFKTLFDHFNIFYDVPAFRVLLPVGISFYTFQLLSYSIDVYRGKQKPEKHLGIFALYVAFFPQLVAGPIERSTRLLPQFYKKNDFDYDRIVAGLKLMAWGFFKKIVIADRLALFVNEAYNNPTEYQGISFIIATLFFTFQIYCDFSGYSDIAIGGAQVFGIRLMTNFERPYFSKSVAEFWRRWHISLSTWFRDYLYIPIGGNRVSRWRWYCNIIIVFLICGMWHGANWTFIVWGILHGIYILIGSLTQTLRGKGTNLVGLDKRPSLLKMINIVFTFTLISFAWIFFRANSLSDAFYIIRNMFTGVDSWLLEAIRNGFSPEVLSPLLLGQNIAEFCTAVCAIIFMEIVHLTQRHRNWIPYLCEKPILYRWAVYYIFALAIFFFGQYTTSTEFIYFQF